VIAGARCVHHHHEMTSSAVLREGLAPDKIAPVLQDDARLRRMLDESFDFIWRSLRRFGLSDDRADDAAQQVFIIASHKLHMIQPESERSFLFGTAMRVASDMRRSAVTRHEIAQADPAAHLVDTAIAADELIDRQRARERVDVVLASMDADLRAVFVLFELEEMPTAEIAALLEIPSGTVASRLRRAREEFELHVTRIKARRGGGQ